MANETGAYFFLINGPEIMSKLAGELLICSAAPPLCQVQTTAKPAVTQVCDRTCITPRTDFISKLAGELLT